MTGDATSTRHTFADRLCGVAVVCLLLSQPVASAAEGKGERHTFGAAGNAPVNIDSDAEFAESLSVYNLFVDPRRQIPNAGVIPYELNTPHFADYATLRRFIWMPEGKSCQYQGDGSLRYPVGATIILTIGYAHDLRMSKRDLRLVETRLWIRRADGWDGAQYVWNVKADEAHLSLAGEHVDVDWIDAAGVRQHHLFRVPNRNQCLQCHEINDQVVPLGPLNARNLNRRFSYASGERNQLRHWVQIGYLTGLPDDLTDVPRIPNWSDPASGDLDSRARAYLDMNCSSCHQPGGIAMTSGLDLRYEQSEPVRYGIFKAPVAAGRAAGNGRFVIEPGKPDRSILVRRLESTDPGIRMPLVGRDRVHAEGVELIRHWISEMRFPKLATAQREIDRRVAKYRRRLGAKPEHSQADASTNRSQPNPQSE